MVGIPFRQKAFVGAYLMKQHMLGRKRYPLVLMLEPLFRCNLACAGCGKIDYPAEILNQRLSVAECLEAVDECGAPVVVIAGGEPLVRKNVEHLIEMLAAIEPKLKLALTTNGAGVTDSASRRPSSFCISRSIFGSSSPMYGMTFPRMSSVGTPG